MTARLKISRLFLRCRLRFQGGTNPENERENIESREKIAKMRSEYLADLTNVPHIDFLTKHRSISRTRFYKLYSRYFHTSPKDDLTRARPEKFRDEIRGNSERKIYEIASDCGFNDIPNFFRLFKRWYGYTPKEYAAAAKLNYNENYAKKAARPKIERLFVKLNLIFAFPRSLRGIDRGHFNSSF